MVQNITSKLICRNSNNTLVCGFVVCLSVVILLVLFWSRHNQLSLRFKVASYMQLVARELNSKLVISIGSIFLLLPLIVALGQAHSTLCSWVKSPVPGHYFTDLATMGTSANNHAPKSTYWLDQWQSGKFSTGSHVVRFPIIN